MPLNMIERWGLVQIVSIDPDLDIQSITPEKVLLAIDFP